MEHIKRVLQGINIPGSSPVSTSLNQAPAKNDMGGRLAIARQKQTRVWNQFCGVPIAMMCKRFDNFDSKLQAPVYNKLKQWDYGQSYVLSSPGIFGVGKTHLVCALVNNVLENETSAEIIESSGIQAIHYKPCPVYYTNETLLLARIRATFDNENKVETEDIVYKTLNKPPLLIIDDIGKMRPRDPSFLQGVYYRVIDDRYINGKSIIITTNLSFDEMGEHIGGASADRLREMCGKDGFIKMIGASYRGM